MLKWTPPWSGKAHAEDPRWFFDVFGFEETDGEKRWSREVPGHGAARSCEQMVLFDPDNYQITCGDRPSCSSWWHKFIKSFR